MMCHYDENAGVQAAKLLHVLQSTTLLATWRSASAGLSAPEQAPDSPDAAASAGGAQLAAGVNGEAPAAAAGSLEPDFSNPDTEKNLAKGLRQTLNRLHTMSLPAALVRANSSEAAAQVTVVHLSLSHVRSNSSCCMMCTSLAGLLLECEWQIHCCTPIVIRSKIPCLALDSMDPICSPAAGGGSRA